MGKNKWNRFAECETFECMIQADFESVFRKKHPISGHWNEQVFKNDRPIVLELGCGRGEYTVGLAKRYPHLNFIGVDIKGARMWRGAKTVTEENIPNAAFLRTRIEFINSFFDDGEVSEIWITFPDPQLKKNRVKKRLTAPGFLEMYAQFLAPDGVIHLKTDCVHLHRYTHAVALCNNLPVHFAGEDIYNDPAVAHDNDLLTIQTTYEAKFRKQGMPITYIRFTLGGRNEFEVPVFEPDEQL